MRRTIFGDARQMVGQGFELAARSGAAWLDLALDARPGRWQDGRAQLPGRVFDQSFYPQLLGLIVLNVIVLGVASEALGQAQLAPATAPIGCPAELLRSDEAFDQDDGMFESLLPVVGKPLQDQLHGTTGQV